MHGGMHGGTHTAHEHMHVMQTHTHAIDTLANRAHIYVRVSILYMYYMNSL